MQDNATTSVAWLSVGDRTICTHETVAVIAADRSDVANVETRAQHQRWGPLRQLWRQDGLSDFDTI